MHTGQKRTDTRIAPTHNDIYGALDQRIQYYPSVDILDRIWQTNFSNAIRSLTYDNGNMPASDYSADDSTIY